MGRQPSGKTPQRPRLSQWEQALLVCEKGQGTAQESLMLLARLDDLGVANALWRVAGVANAPAESELEMVQESLTLRAKLGTSASLMRLGPTLESLMLQLYNV